MPLEFICIWFRLVKWDEMRSSHCPEPPYKELLPSVSKGNRKGLVGKVKMGTGHQSPKRSHGLAVVQKSPAIPGHECQKLSWLAQVCQHVLTANWASTPVRRDLHPVLHPRVYIPFPREYNWLASFVSSFQGMWRADREQSLQWGMKMRLWLLKFIPLA